MGFINDYYYALLCQFLSIFYLKKFILEYLQNYFLNLSISQSNGG